MAYSLKIKCPKIIFEYNEAYQQKYYILILLKFSYKLIYYVKN